MADCHLGGWREEKLKQIGLQSFTKAIDVCIEKQVDFVIISGDLFNTAMPGIAVLSHCVEQLKRLKDKTIPVYVIVGSHDCSASGDTMMDVLEKAGLVVNVMKLKDKKLQVTIDEKTNVGLTGVFGRRAGLETEDYKSLDFLEVEQQTGFNIFLFHTAIEEFKPENLDAVTCHSYKELPQNCNYYAGGHVHYLLQKKVGEKGTLTYPGALYPNNFGELEEFKMGHFYIVDENVNIEDIWLPIKEVITKTISVDGLRPSEAEDMIIETVKKIDAVDKIVLLRIKGAITDGRTVDINLGQIDTILKDAYIVLKHTAKLVVKEEEQELLTVEQTPEAIEKEIITTKVELKDKQTIAQTLMEQLVLEKADGETIAGFDERIIKNAIKSMKIEKLVYDED